MAELPSEPELIVACPHCGVRVTVAIAGESREYVCWSCRQPFEMPAMTLTPLEAASSALPEDQADPGGDELDELRIRRLSMERRAAWRSRSHVLVVAGVMAVATGQFVVLAARTLDRGIHATTLLYGFAAVLASIVTARFLTRARRIREEIERSSRHADPDVPPDFRRLSDGSHRWKNLQAMRAPENGVSPHFQDRSEKPGEAENGD